MKRCIYFHEKKKKKKIEKNVNYTEMEFILSLYRYVLTYIEISMSSREFEVVYNFLTLPRKISKYCIIPRALISSNKHCARILCICNYTTRSIIHFFFIHYSFTPLLRCHQRYLHYFPKKINKIFS